MKTSVKIITSLLLTLVVITSLSGCGLLDKYKKWDGNIIEVTENSKECVEDFAVALSNADFETAKSYLHPNSTPSADELEAYIEQVKAEHDFDLTEEPTFEFGSFEPVVNLDCVKYDLSVKATVGDEVISLRLGILSDEHGFGIYNIEVE